MGFVIACSSQILLVINGVFEERFASICGMGAARKMWEEDVCGVKSFCFW